MGGDGNALWLCCSKWELPAYSTEQLGNQCDIGVWGQGRETVWGWAEGREGRGQARKGVKRSVRPGEQGSDRDRATF